MLKAENIVSSHQYRIAGFVVWLLICVLLSRYFQIQILEHERYSSKSNTNRIRKVTKNAPRGLILDRNGDILVENFPIYVLTAIPGEMTDQDIQFKLISNYIESDSAILASNYNKYYRGQFIPTRLAKDLNFEQISRLEENKLNLQGIYFDQIPERYFPSRVKAPHLFGYVKEVDRQIRESLINGELYELGDLVGWTGLEKQYEIFLMGNRGIYFYEVDVFGREVGPAIELDPKKPDPGQNIQTTLDLDLQAFIEKQMIDRKGIALVGHPESGEILSAVSSPDYSPDLFTGFTTEREWSEIQTDPDRPLLNRYTQGTYPPASIVKMIMEAVLLEKTDFDVEMVQVCTGSYQYGDRIFGCWLPEGHGELNMSEAMAVSCDVYFYKAIRATNIDQVYNMFLSFGFGKKTGVDIPNEAEGLIPNKDYMFKRYGRFGWSKGSLLNIAIGQGELLVTPIQVLNYVNLLATRGSSPVCHFVMANNLPQNVRPELDSSTWDRILFDMRTVITHDKGTGRKAQPAIKGMKIFGKTGTAENPHGDDHAWFIGWAEYLGEKYSLVLLLENGGSGGTVAAPIAKIIFSQFESGMDLASK